MTRLEKVLYCCMEDDLVKLCNLVKELPPGEQSALMVYCAGAKVLVERFDTYSAIRGFLVGYYSAMEKKQVDSEVSELEKLYESDTETN